MSTWHEPSNEEKLKNLRVREAQAKKVLDSSLLDLEGCKTVRAELLEIRAGIKAINQLASRTLP